MRKLSSLKKYLLLFLCLRSVCALPDNRVLLEYQSGSMDFSCNLLFNTFNTKISKVINNYLQFSVKRPHDRLVVDYIGDFFVSKLSNNNIEIKIRIIKVGSKDDDPYKNFEITGNYPPNSHSWDKWMDGAIENILFLSRKNTMEHLYISFRTPSTDNTLSSLLPRHFKQKLEAEKAKFITCFFYKEENFTPEEYNDYIWCELTTPGKGLVKYKIHGRDEVTQEVKGADTNGIVLEMARVSYASLYTFMEQLRQIAKKRN